MTATLIHAALDCLHCSDAALKSQRTLAAAAAFARGELLPDADSTLPPPPEFPGRPPRPQLVDARALPRRGLGSAAGRIALLHAVAHIEFNAINLAWDAVARFRGMPADYYRDWCACAADEARHFGLLRARLQALGADYGDLPAHDGLWTMARRTADDVLARMALVPRVLEARVFPFCQSFLQMSFRIKFLP